MKPLPSAPAYQIGDDGTVYGQFGKPLKPWIDNGYYRITICVDGTQRKRYVHELFLETYVGPRPDGQVARHGILGPLVNNLENLCWGTYSDNEWDKVAHGTHQNKSKTECKRGHSLGVYARVTKDGRRQCRLCVNLLRAERRAAAQAA